VDDAVGEAYDKVARLLGLGYPGGAAVDKLAAAGEPRIPFPRPRASGLDMSVSGLQTAVKSWVERHPESPAAEVAASFQAAVCDVLVDRCERAARATGVSRLALGGGVAANSGLRTRLAATGLELFLPPRARCTDNAAMIANVGRLHLERWPERYRLADRLATLARARWAVGEA
jgi:N6-L-threonylcarbamoyladenine synthase